MPNIDDRRAKRSRKMLKQGLLELMREKKFSLISIKDITERMDLNRGTFYLHYPNTISLLQSVEKDIIDEATVIVEEHLKIYDQDKSLYGFFKALFDYIIDHRTDFETLLANDTTSYLIQRFKNLVHDIGSNIIQVKYTDVQDDKLNYLLGFIGYGLIGLIKMWFEAKTEISEDAMLNNAVNLVEGATEKFLSCE